GERRHSAFASPLLDQRRFRGVEPDHEYLRRNWSPSSRRLPQPEPRQAPVPHEEGLTASAERHSQGSPAPRWPPLTVWGAPLARSSGDPERGMTDSWSSGMPEQTASTHPAGLGSGGSRLAGVDGVRALAALSVLVWHVWAHTTLANKY